MKTMICNYCGNVVENESHSNQPELHVEKCPIREMMEVRLDRVIEEKRKENAIIIPKGSFIFVNHLRHMVLEDIDVTDKVKVS